MEVLHAITPPSSRRAAAAGRNCETTSYQERPQTLPSHINSMILYSNKNSKLCHAVVVKPLPRARVVVTFRNTALETTFVRRVPVLL